MTEKEIEKQSEEYAKHNATVINNARADKSIYDDREEIKQAFKEGAKWEMEHSVEWHDLRKDPNDLPKCAENQQIIFYVQEYYKCIEKSINHYCLGFYKKSFLNDDVKLFVEKSKGYECEHSTEAVLRWCELPQFKDKEKEK